MKRIPKTLINAANDRPMNIDQHNIAHARGAGGLYATACERQGQPVTLAQALVYAAGWCNLCYEQPRAHGGKP